MYFILGACFFVYLPVLPIILLLCSWKRRCDARRRLKKKAKRKHDRLMQKKRDGKLRLFYLPCRVTTMTF